jgi:hypothetical protein
MSIATDFPTDSALQTRRVWLAPICLCLVAGLHCLRVTTAGQTPWKGGGFGMFSTIDSEHSRFVHAYLLTNDGPLPLQIPSELDKKVAELRATPHQALAKELAAKLAERSWIDPQALQQTIAEQLRQQPGNVPLTGEQLRELRSATNPTATEPGRLSTNLLVAAKADSSNAIPNDGIRVEVLKYEMPAGTTQLHTRLLFFASQIKQEQQP